MHVFKTERSNQYLYFAKRLLEAFIAISIAFLFLEIFKKHFDVISYCIFIGVPTLMQIRRDINEERITEIVINNDLSITYTFKTLISSLQKATLAPDNLSIEVSKGLSKTIFKIRTTLTFLDNGKEKFKLSRYKDGFSIDSIKQICAGFIETPVPILQ